jgi:hypothetical protein
MKMDTHAPSIPYGRLMHDAMRDLIRNVLTDVAQYGLPGDHHFFITFQTDAQGVELADWLRERHPDEMTIIIQHWFDALEVDDTGFSIILNFGNAPEPLRIPFDAIITFVDPSVEFGLRFDGADASSDDIEEDIDFELEDAPHPSDDQPKGQVVRLDQFRKG